MKEIKHTNYTIVAFLMSILLSGLTKGALIVFFGVNVYGVRYILIAAFVFTVLYYLFRKYG